MSHLLFFSDVPCQELIKTGGPHREGGGKRVPPKVKSVNLCGNADFLGGRKLGSCGGECQPSSRCYSLLLSLNHERLKKRACTEKNLAALNEEKVA